MFIRSGYHLKPLPVAFVVAAVLVVIYQVSQSNGLFQPTDEVQERLPAPISTLVINKNVVANADAALKHAQDALTKKPETTVVDAPVAASPVVPQANAWQVDQQLSPIIPLPESVVVYEPVRLDMDSPAFPTVGEQVKLELPGGGEVIANVQSGHENPNGDYSWRGYLHGHGDEYPVVMTYGSNSVFATITTPQGSYTLESVNGSGWVYKNPSEFELSTPGKNDYLEIPHEHIHE